MSLTSIIPPLLFRPRHVLPGLVLAVLVALAAVGLKQVLGLALVSPLIAAIVLGTVFANSIRVPAAAAQGIGFAMRPLLRAGIVLLGFQITFGQVLSMGVPALLIVAGTLASTFCFTLVAGRLLGVPKPLTELIAAGTSVCGASAIVAATPLARARESDVAYALATVTLFGTVAMLVYPLIGAALGLDVLGYGIWAGASIHEVGQVTAAAFQFGDEAGQYGTLSKLFRVTLLVAVLASLALRRRVERADDGIESGAPLPVYVMAFVGVVFVNSVLPVPGIVTEIAHGSSLALLCVAMAAMGLQTDFRNVMAMGWRPMVLGLIASVFISGVSLSLIFATGM